MFLIVLAAIIATGLVSHDPVLKMTLSPSWLIAPVIGAYWLGAAVLGAASARMDMRVVLQGAGRRGQKAAALARTTQHGWLIFGSAGVVACGYGRWAFDTLGHLPLLPELAAALPLAVALVCLLSAAYAPYRTARLALSARSDSPPSSPIWTRWGHLSYHLRSSLLMVGVPLSMLVLVLQSLELYAKPHLSDAMLLATTAASVACVFLIAPIVVVRVLKTRPLPDGPLRRDLQRMAREMGFGFRDLRVWDTGGVVVNAAVMGLVRPLRYVLITDAVLARMDTRRVQAIFAHEAGHVLFHHLPWYLVFAAATVMVSSVIGIAAARLPATPEWTHQAVSMVVMAVAWLGGFGWISRRFERQADVTAAWAGACDPQGRIPFAGAALFADALQDLAIMNGRPLERRSWGHGSIRSRIEYLRALASSGGTRDQIGRGVGRIKAVLLAALAAGLLAMVGLGMLESWS